MRTLLSVNIEVDGKWPTDLELQNRNAVISDLSQQNMGNLKGAGAERGGMNFSYEVHDVPAAKRQIGKALHEHLPGYQHSIQGTDVSMNRAVRPANQNLLPPQQNQIKSPKIDVGMGR